jgi:hypothetical protein
MKIAKKKQNKKPLIVIIALIIIVAACIGIYYLVNRSNQSTPDSINYNPPTQEEIDASQDAKKRNDEKNNEEKNPTDDKPTINSNENSSTPQKNASVGITYADVFDGKLEIRAFTDSVIEGNGTCVATIHSGGVTKEASSKAFVDATSSICQPIYFNISDLTPGTWSVTVTYTSPDAKGVSETTEIKI